MQCHGQDSRLNRQLEYRKMLLDQSVASHDGNALQFSHRMEESQDKFTSVRLAHDVDSARHLLQQHQEDLKQNILELSVNILQEGQLLLDRIREMGMHAHLQNRHATMAACYGIEHLLELLQDRHRRHLEELWLQRKIRLGQCLQLQLLLDQEVNKLSNWYEKVGDVYLSRKDLGDSLVATRTLVQDERVHFEQQANEIQETILRLIRTADQLLVQSEERSDAESARHRRMQTVDGKCESFMLRLDARRKHLALGENFFTYAQALKKLDEIEIQLESSDLPRNNAALTERHAYLSNCVIEATTPAFHTADRTLLERVGRDDPRVQGVNDAPCRLYALVTCHLVMGYRELWGSEEQGLLYGGSHSSDHAFC